jgi:hypothetical protein
MGGRALLVRLYLAAVGFLPVTLIGASTFGVWTLRELTVWLLVPWAVATAGVLGGSKEARALAGRGLVIGLAATFLYDLFRWSFLWFRWMQTDPIVHIGSALGLSPDWLFGYLWRYIGNGGGMGIAFVACGLHGVRVGMAYGLFVCAGLFTVLLVSPSGEHMLFPLEPTTIVMATVGHLIYGATLGTLTPWDAVAARLTFRLEPSTGLVTER